MWEVIRFGEPLFTKIPGTEWRLDFSGYVELAKEYLCYAEDAERKENFRIAVDIGYNAAELLAKALIISTEAPLASSHGGVVNQFGRLFCLSKRINPQLGRDLNLSLQLRAKTKYRPDARLSKENARFVIDVAKKLLEIGEEYL